MAETWEDCVALLRAGASPSEVLPKLRELINSEAPLPFPQPQGSSDPGISQLTSICHHKIGDVVVQLPYAQPPPTLWTELSNYSDEEIFDTETVIDVMQEFSPIVVGPPEKEILEMLNEIDLSCSPGEDAKNSAGDPLEDEDGFDFGNAFTMLENILRGADDPDHIGECNIPMLSETEWALVLSDIEFNGAGKEALIDLVRCVNQQSFSRVILHSILPILADEIEWEDFLELVSIVASSAEVCSMPYDELLNLMNVYRGMDSKGALAQLQILCCKEVS